MGSTPKFRPRKGRVSPPEHVVSAFEAKYGGAEGDDANEVNETKTAPPARRAPLKERATFYLPADLLDELRNAVVALRGAPQRFTMASIVEAGVRAELQRLQEEHNDGRVFPGRAIEPYVGRPPK